MTAGLIEFLVQIATFVAGQHTVGFVLALKLTDFALFLDQPARLVFGEFAGAHTLTDAIRLVVLALVNAMVNAFVTVVFFLIDMTTGLILLLVEIAAFITGQYAIGFVLALGLADRALLLDEPARLVAGEFAGTHALLDAIRLIVLALVNAIARVLGMVVMGAVVAGARPGMRGIGRLTQHGHGGHNDDSGQGDEFPGQHVTYLLYGLSVV